MDTLDDANGTQAWMDGNAAAGILASVFVLDATRARIVCAGCGRAAAIAEQRVFALEMGAVLRCPSCAGITLRLAATPHGCFIDMRGAEVVHFA
jgi:Zn finger protein HypA/HybF involved in hydrogenase expression